MSINFGGLALAVLAGVIGSVSATSAAGHLSGPALSGAAVAGALTGVIAFAIPPRHDQSGGAQVLQGVETAAAVASAALPAQAQPAAAGVLTQVGAAAVSVPAAATATGPAPSGADWSALLSRLDALLAQRPAAPAPGAVSTFSADAEADA